jgi:hypothetical protein
MVESPIQHPGFPLFSAVAPHPTISNEIPHDRAAIFTRYPVCETEVWEDVRRGSFWLVHFANLGCPIINSEGNGLPLQPCHSVPTVVGTLPPHGKAGGMRSYLYQPGLTPKL